MKINRKYFVCVEDLTHYPEEQTTVNTFVSSVSWSVYTTYDGRGWYETPTQHNYWEFTAGKIYPQAGCNEDSSIRLFDNHGRVIDIAEHNLLNYFTELKIEIDERIDKSFKIFEEKGYNITLLPVSCSFDAKTKKIGFVTYHISLTNTRLPGHTWFRVGSCVCTDISLGFEHAVRNFKRHSPNAEALRYALKGNYLSYANNKLREKRTKDANLERLRTFTLR